MTAWEENDRELQALREKEQYNQHMSDCRSRMKRLKTTMEGAVAFSVVMSIMFVIFFTKEFNTDDSALANTPLWASVLFSLIMIAGSLTAYFKREPLAYLVTAGAALILMLITRSWILAIFIVTFAVFCILSLDASKLKKEQGYPTFTDKI